MRKKRFLAVLLAASMTMASAVTAVAAPTLESGSKSNVAAETVTGKGQTEGIVDTDIFNVVVPTTVSEASVFDYIFDPQELITATDAARWISGNANLDGVNVSINSSNGFTPSTLYFVNGLSANGQAVNSSNGLRLTNTSDPYTLINKSTMEVDVSVNAKLTGAVGVIVSTNDTLSDNQTTMYMKLLEDGTTKEKLISTNNAPGYLLTATMADAKDKYTKTLLSDNRTYRYAISSNVSDNEFAGRYAFKLTGAANENADWSMFASGKVGAQTLTLPQVEVTYYLTPHVEKAAISPSESTIRQGQAVELNVDLGSQGATGITSIAYKNSSGQDRTLAAESYTFANGKLTLTEAYINDLYGALTAGASREYTVTFNNGEKVIFTLKR